MDNEFIYGKDEAARVLFLKIKDNPVVRRRVSRFLNRYGRLLNSVSTQDRELATILYKLIRDDALKSVNDSKHFAEIRSYLCNVVVGHYRNYYRRLS